MILFDDIVTDNVSTTLNLWCGSGSQTCPAIGPLGTSLKPKFEQLLRLRAERNSRAFT